MCVCLFPRVSSFRLIVLLLFFIANICFSEEIEIMCWLLSEIALKCLIKRKFTFTNKTESKSMLYKFHKTTEYSNRIINYYYWIVHWRSVIIRCTKVWSHWTCLNNWEHIHCLVIWWSSYWMCFTIYNRTCVILSDLDHTNLIEWKTFECEIYWFDCLRCWMWVNVSETFHT